MAIPVKRSPPRIIREAAGVFDLPRMLRPPATPPAVWDAISQDWQTIGADLRQAMMEYERSRATR